MNLKNMTRHFLFNQIINKIIDKKKINRNNVKQQYDRIINTTFNECDICYDNISNVFMYCCLNMLCVECHEKIATCPFCRTDNYMFCVV